ARRVHEVDLPVARGDEHPAVGDERGGGAEGALGAVAPDLLERRRDGARLGRPGRRRRTERPLRPERVAAGQQGRKGTREKEGKGDPKAGVRARSLSPIHPFPLSHQKSHPKKNWLKGSRASHSSPFAKR